MRVCGKLVSFWSEGERHLGRGDVGQGYVVMVKGSGVREDVAAVLAALTLMGGEEAWCARFGW